MYHELDIRHFVNLFKLSEQEMPEALILYGGFKNLKSVEIWAEKVEARKSDFFYPVYFGREQGHNLAVTKAYGATQTFELVKIFAELGVRVAILHGSFGALQPNIKFGEVAVVQSVFNEGSFPFEVSNKHIFKGDPDLIQIAGQVLQAGNIPFHNCNFVSYFAMLAETKEKISDWKRKGFDGVDLESAVFYAQCAKYDLPSVAIHTVADNLVENLTVFDVREDEKIIKRARKDELFNISLDVAVKYLETNQTP